MSLQAQLSYVGGDSWRHTLRDVSSLQEYAETTAFGSAKEVQINGKRLWAEIMETASFGGIEGTTGMHRLALSKSDFAVREWFIQKAEQIGCHVSTDRIGNIFAQLPGIDNSLSPIGIGSHLDTQPQGGRFDGILGVLGGLEVLRSLRESGVKTQRPIVVINWTNEEGARFESGCTGSAVWAGYKSLTEAYEMRTIDGESTMKAELDKFCLSGTRPSDHKLNPLCAQFELHIEQGPRLEQAGKSIGVVQGIQGNRRFRVQVQGKVAHAGSTPMIQRADALVASSKMILLVEEIAVKHGGFGTVGVIQCPDGSINCVPGEVRFAVDLRHPNADDLNNMEHTIMKRVRALQFENPKLQFHIEKVWESPAVTFDRIAVSCVRSSTVRRFGEDAAMQMVSFAGHDSAMTQRCCPTAMIFAPSRNGISHAPEEFTSEIDCANSVQVLADTVLLYDRLQTLSAESKYSAPN